MRRGAEAETMVAAGVVHRVGTKAVGAVAGSAVVWAAARVVVWAAARAVARAGVWAEWTVEALVAQREGAMASFPFRRQCP